MRRVTRSGGRDRAALALAGLFAIGATGTARAQTPAATGPAVGAKSVSETQAAELLMQAGRLDDARKVLADLERRLPRDPQVRFLLGMMAVQDGRYALAASRFRAILAREPRQVRVRLELARAFFLLKDYDSAERQFRLARAGDLPAAARSNVDHYLFMIRRVRRFTHALSVAVVPDSNINVGPSATTIGVFGLPFTLSPGARRQSGVGGQLSASGEWSPPIARDAQFRLGATVDTLDYPHGAFDDTTVSAYAGPKFFTRRWEISPLLTGFYRWYGNRFYNQGVGGALQAVDYATPKLGLTGSIGGQSVTYGGAAGQSGVAVTGSLGAFYTLTPLSVVSGGVSATRQDAALGAYAYTAEQVRLSYDRDLPHGWSVSIQSSYAFIDYDAALAAFGVTRRDRQFSARVSILNRRIDLRGFTPRLSYVYTHNSSNIPLYAYDRSQFQVGLTRAF